MAQITKRHNLKELYEMGYQPIPGEIFKRFGKTVSFVELDDIERHTHTSKLVNGVWEPDLIPNNEKGVYYLNEKGQKMSCYPMTSLEKEVTYEVIFNQPK